MGVPVQAGSAGREGPATWGADDLHPNGTDTVVLIHGLWMTALIWEQWIARYRARGYRVLAPGWPGLDRGIAELRRDPSGIARLRVTDITAHYGHLIGGLSPPPALIGHCLGGLVVQILLDGGLGLLRRARGLRAHARACVRLSGIEGRRSLVPLRTTLAGGLRGGASASRRAARHSRRRPRPLLARRSQALRPGSRLTSTIAPGLRINALLSGLSFSVRRPGPGWREFRPGSLPC